MLMGTINHNSMPGLDAWMPSPSGLGVSIRSYDNGRNTRQCGVGACGDAGGGGIIMTLTVEDRFFNKVHVSAWGCWSWLAALDKDGYGSFRVGKKQRRAHRVSYEIFTGEIPKRFQLDHLCRNRSCVNPQHLEVVTPFVNTIRGFGLSAAQQRKVFCPNGHSYDTIREYKPGKYCRRCSICYKEKVLFFNRKRGYAIT